VSCAVQNMWLAATAAGVHGYWSSWQEAGACPAGRAPPPGREATRLRQRAHARAPRPHAAAPLLPHAPANASPHSLPHALPARTAPEMLEFLGMEPGDQCLGFFVAGIAEPERLAGYKASRRPLEGIVEWRS
jgi:hypothetical protein